MRVFAAAAVLLLFGCERISKWTSNVNFVEEPEVSVNTSLMVPAEVWDDIEQTYKMIEVPNKDELVDMRATLFPMQVQLIEKTVGVLGRKNFLIPIPDGGGLLDLSRYVEKGRRSFYLKFLLEEELPEVTKVYFIPHYLPQIAGGNRLGLKCSAAVDITTYFREEILKNGILLNTSNWRYLNTVGGTFVIFYFKDLKIYTAQLTIHDSRRKKFLCTQDT